MAMPAASGSQVLVSLPQDAAYDRLVSALQQAGCEITGQNRPAAVSFNAIKQSIWTTSGFKVVFPGSATVTPTATGSQVQMSAKIAWGTATPMFLMYGGMGLVLMLFGWGLYGILLAALGAGSTAFILSSSGADESLRKVAAQLTGGAAAPAAPAPAPTPQPAAAAPTASAPTAAAANADDSLAQIERLAHLRDSGAISAAEYEAKKDELLKRV
jgi:hypothetical protein